MANFGVNPCCEISLGPPQMNSLTGPTGCEIVAESIVDGERWVSIVTFSSRLNWFSDHNKWDYYIHVNSNFGMTVVDMHEKLYIMYALAWS